MVEPAKEQTTESRRHRDLKTPCLGVSVVPIKGFEMLSSFIRLNKETNK